MAKEREAVGKEAAWHGMVSVLLEEDGERRGVGEGDEVRVIYRTPRQIRSSWLLGMGFGLGMETRKEWNPMQLHSFQHKDNGFLEIQRSWSLCVSLEEKQGC